MKKFSRFVLTAGTFLVAATLSAAPPHGSFGGHSSGHSGHSGSFHGGSRSGFRGGFHGGFRNGGRVFIRGGFGWGWGWWGWPGWWGYGYPYGYPYGYVGYGYPGYGYGAPGSWAVIDTDVSPDQARVYLDGRYIGTADDFDGNPDYLYLRPGQYKLEFRLEGFETRTVDVNARAGAKQDIDGKLAKIPGAKQYGSYDTPQPEGGLHRYFGKDKNGTRPYDGDYGPPPQDDRYGDNGRDQSGDWRGRREGPPPSDADADAPPAPAPDASVSARPPASAAGKARLVLRAEPGDAAVYVDDRFVGTAEELSSLPRGLQLPAGKHKVVISRPGYATHAEQVDLTPGKPETLEISLERP